MVRARLAPGSYPGGVPPLTDALDLASLHLSAGEGRRLQLAVAIVPLQLGGERYAADPVRPQVTVDVSRMVGGGYALRLRFAAALAGPCMRCLAAAAPTVEVDAREVDRPGGGRSSPAPTSAARRSTSRRGRATRSRWAPPFRSSAARTAPASARCARPTSTRPAPSTTTSAPRTRGGRSCGSSSSSSADGGHGARAQRVWPESP